jgi:dienelactone hydrolase
MSNIKLMQKQTWAVVSMMLVAATILTAQQPDAKKDALSAAAKGFVEHLSRGEYASGVALFDSTMKSAMPEARLKGTWEGVTAQAGQVRSMPAVSLVKYAAYDIALVTCQGEHKTFVTRVVFDAKGRIAGLFFADQVADYKAPLYVVRNTFKEVETGVPSPDGPLGATLCVPEGDGPFPALVLVHGSGPNDRDETIGPNKPFRDLAWGLASKGIAVLRYEKRTKQYAAKLVARLSTFTVSDETVDDALAAVDLLRHTEKIDQRRIFVLGHSLGGMLVPMIGIRDADIAGFVVLAGAARHLEDLMLEQVTYIAGLKGSLTEAEKNQIAETRKQVEKVKSLKASDAGSSKLIFNAPPSYWLDLKSYDPPEVAASLKQPMLILQGERDYQVTMTDFDRWKMGLQGRKNVAFKAYPDLNHLFMEGVGKSTPSEYEKVGHVAAYVIDDIAGWIGK